MAAGLGLCLITQRDEAPDWLTFWAACSLHTGSVVLRLMALRMPLQRPMPVRQALAGWLVMTAIYGLYLLTPDLKVRAAFNSTMLMLGTSSISWHASRLAHQTRSAGGLLLTWAEAVLAAALAVRLVAILMGWATEYGGPTRNWDFALLIIVAAIVGLYGNLGYLGMALDRSSAGAALARETALAETVRREATESTATALRTLLLQRDGLMAEREKLLQLLAHEIRQPLHNASGALQAADIALHNPQEAGGGLVAERLRRAQALMGDVRSVLDNTLASATLLTRNEPLVLQDVDIDFIIELTLGDLTEDQRSGVQRRWSTSLRSADIEPGLVRLALRNLLHNAFRHGGPGVRVQLEVAEQDDPPALLLTVCDKGPGAAVAHLQAVAAVDQAARLLLPQAPPLAPKGLGS